MHETDPGGTKGHENRLMKNATLQAPQKAQRLWDGKTTKTAKQEWCPVAGEVTKPDMAEPTVTGMKEIPLERPHDHRGQLL